MTWKTVTFGRFLKERRGKYKPQQANELGLQRVEKIEFSGTIFVGDKPTNTDMILVKPGDLLISGINAEKGAIAVYEGEQDVLATIHYSAYQYDEDQIDIDYLKWFLKSDVFRKLLKANAANGIKTELRAKHLLPLPIALPPLPVQHEIIAQLNARYSTVEAIETHLARQQNRLTALRQAILREAVQGQLTAKWRVETQGFEPSATETGADLLARIRTHKAQLIKAGTLKKEKPLPPIAEADIPFELPESWVWCRLGEVVSCERGRFSIRPRNDPSYFDGPFPFIQIGDLPDDGSTVSAHTQTLNQKGLKVSKMFPAGTIAIAIVGATIGNTGVLGYDMCFTDSIVGIKPSDFYNSSFINFCLIANKNNYRTLSYAGGGQPNIKLPILNETIIALPSLAEQQAIVARVGELLARADAVAGRLAVARQQAGALRQAVLREAFVGEMENEV
jgi:type I restriction enzyme, S subunit